jgi:hypothetical protein
MELTYQYLQFCAQMSSWSPEELHAHALGQLGADASDRAADLAIWVQKLMADDQSRLQQQPQPQHQQEPQSQRQRQLQRQQSLHDQRVGRQTGGTSNHVATTI